MFFSQVNMPADSFESPLTLAACGGHVELANLLVERGANLEEVNDEGYTPLMEASREGHEDMVTLLLAHGQWSKKCVVGLVPALRVITLEGPLIHNDCGAGLIFLINFEGIFVLAELYPEINCKGMLEVPNNDSLLCTICIQYLVSN